MAARDDVEQTINDSPNILFYEKFHNLHINNPRMDIQVFLTLASLLIPLLNKSG